MAVSQDSVEVEEDEEERKPSKIRKFFGIKDKEKESERSRLRSKSPTRVVDEFNCALAYGMLLQGKMYVQRNMLKFVSIFNKNTFFGKTRI